MNGQRVNDESKTTTTKREGGDGCVGKGRGWSSLPPPPRCCVATPGRMMQCPLRPCMGGGKERKLLCRVCAGTCGDVRGEGLAVRETWTHLHTHTWCM